MVDEERNQLAPLDASALLQIGTTVAAVAVALATIAQDNGPTLGGLQLVPASFLLAGIVSIYGSLWAMAAIWTAAGMRFDRDIFGGNAMAHDQDIGVDGYRALVVITWSLWFLTLVYVAQLFTTTF